MSARKEVKKLARDAVRRAVRRKKVAEKKASAGAALMARYARKRMGKRAAKSDRKFGNDCFESKEMVSDMKSSISYNVAGFDINPTDPIMFPRLSKIARLYQEWKCEYIKFHFESTSSNALTGTNTALGKYVMAVQYNPDAPNFHSIQAALTDTKSKISKPAQSCSYNFDFSAAFVGKDGRMFVEYDGITSPKTTWSLGTLNFCTEGSQAIATIGTLWVSYKIKFYKPTVEAGYVGLSSSRYGPMPISGRALPLNMTVVSNSIPLVIQNSGTHSNGSDLLLPRTPSNDYYLVSYSAAGTFNTSGGGDLKYSAGTGVEISTSYFGDPGYLNREGNTWLSCTLTLLVRIPPDVTNGVTFWFTATQSVMDINLCVFSLSDAYSVYFPSPTLLALPRARVAAAAGIPEPAPAEAKEEA